MSRSTRLSRREFATVVAGAAAAASVTPLARASESRQGTLTVGQVIDRIREQIGVPWNAETVDTLKVGDPASRVTGIVTTALPTIAVLREAAASGANLIVTSQPTFYSRADAPTPPVGRGGGAGRRGGGPPPEPRPDAVYDAKNALLSTEGLAVFRLSDHWRLRRPDPFAAGLAEALGWTVGAAGGDAEFARAELTPVTLEALARDAARRLGSRGGVRVIGDPATPLSSAALLPGSIPITTSVAALPDVDVIVAGEVREWETTEYVRDVLHAGNRKGLVLLGRIVSEDPGMKVCADWLATLVEGVPVRHVAAGDPYWRPA